MWFVLNKKHMVVFVIFIFLASFSHCFTVHPMPCNVSLTKSCRASLYYVPNAPISLEETASLFRINSSLVKRTVDGFVISVNCGCLADHNEFTWHMDYVVQPGDTWDRISLKFGSFVMQKPDKTLIVSQNITLDMLCGCSKNVDVVTYRIESGDTLFTICSRFNSDVNKTTVLNKLMNPGVIYAGDVILIPESEGLKNLILLDTDSKVPYPADPKAKRKSKSQIHIIVGIVLAAVVLLLSSIVTISWIFYYKRKDIRQSKAYMRARHCFPDYFNSSSFHTESEESMVSSIYSDKTIVFPYNEVCDATSNFSMSLKIGQGSYGSVYLGKLRGTDVAIKQMKNTNSKEFLSELNILCNVHHTNLIELIGYAAGGESLFLVYEFAQNGALSDHLRNPSVKGYKPLTWTTRVQIALDAAKGLEYIHVHTRPYYVHRDVKTSNILLDSSFHAKIADFGLVKLLEQSPEVGTAASRIVGTFGYLAPEYIRDGCVTIKSDVYAFGVVLMELLTGQPALTRNASPENAQYDEHRSLVEHMQSVLEDKDPWTKLSQCIDGNLTHYHEDSLFKMALLAKDCVEDVWYRRPDMCLVVLRLSLILKCSMDWERVESGSPMS